MVRNGCLVGEGGGRGKKGHEEHSLCGTLTAQQIPVPVQGGPVTHRGTPRGPGGTR